MLDMLGFSLPKNYFMRQQYCFNSQYGLIVWLLSVNYMWNLKKMFHNIFRLTMDRNIATKSEFLSGFRASALTIKVTQAFR